ncbi:hypothetical protein WR164_16010 [Philodulcilactobacillus myokoensis]|uniref:Uncharacterized protein n=1 Tax=Philodulcilactobacillus myokoensis TaxID=2929573 RepID=A0A9W6B2E5_9LACO|nr:hypothetical protein [Philodulcilactobacillus myokoensis]GLB47622.1 hypothetical protein WR164_16010 [Philodulcilactobacillus myokoensis]
MLNKHDEHKIIKTKRKQVVKSKIPSNVIGIVRYNHDDNQGYHYNDFKNLNYFRNAKLKFKKNRNNFNLNPFQKGIIHLFVSGFDNKRKVYILTQQYGFISNPLEVKNEPIIFICSVKDLFYQSRMYNKLDMPIGHWDAFIVSKINQNGNSKPVIIVQHRPTIDDNINFLINDTKKFNAVGKKLYLIGRVRCINPRIGMWVTYHNASIFMPNRYIYGYRKKKDHYEKKRRFYSLRCCDIYHIGQRVKMIVILPQNGDQSEDGVLLAPANPPRVPTCLDKLNSIKPILNKVQGGFITGQRLKTQYVHINSGLDVMVKRTNHLINSLVPVVATHVVGKAKFISGVNKVNYEDHYKYLKAMLAPSVDHNGHRYVWVNQNIMFEITNENDLPSRLNNEIVYIQISIIRVRGYISDETTGERLLNEYEAQDVANHRSITN